MLVEELQAALEFSYDGIYITDSNGITLYVNNSYERITGRKRSEFIGKHIQELENSGMFSPIITPFILENKIPITINQILKNGKKVVITGNPVFNQDGGISFVITNVRDITEIDSLYAEIAKHKELSSNYLNKITQLNREKELKEAIIYRSSAMDNVISLASKVAKLDTTVLITGETGVGKELLVNYVHQLSDRKNERIVAVNCGALARSLLETELFGYVKGAFTGAMDKNRLGLFEVANKGIVFLDEIGDMPIDLQVKILRVLQEGEIKRVGSSDTIKVDVRIIAATNKELNQLVSDGKFRKDLFYRLNVINIEIPPLRDRIDDIAPLAHYFCKYFNDKYQLSRTLTTELVDVLTEYSWPGNVRELRNTMEKLAILSNENELKVNHLPKAIKDNVNELIFKEEKLMDKELIVIEAENFDGIDIAVENMHKISDKRYYPLINFDGYRKDAQDLQILLNSTNESIVFVFNVDIKMLEVVENFITNSLNSANIICGLNKDLINSIKRDKKYESLLNNVDIIKLNVLPLAQANGSSNITQKIMFYFNYFSNKYNINSKISPTIQIVLANFPWTDTDELKKAIEEIVLKNVKELDLIHLPQNIYNSYVENQKPIVVNRIIPLKSALKLLEQQLIDMAIKKHGSKRKAAIELGVNPSSILRKIEKHNKD